MILRVLTRTETIGTIRISNRHC